MTSERVKKLIFEFLLRDLYAVEIIYYRDSVWFIDREQRYWYFEYHKEDKHLWWRWSHFKGAMEMFSMDAEEKQEIFGELINMILSKKQELESKYPNKVFKTIGSVINFKEEVGKNKNFEVEKTLSGGDRKTMEAHKILDNEVETTDSINLWNGSEVDEVLNCEVKTSMDFCFRRDQLVNEVLNNEVETTGFRGGRGEPWVDEVLDYEVKTTNGYGWKPKPVVDEVLNHEAETIKQYDGERSAGVDNVLNHEIETIHPKHTTQYQRVDDVLDNEVETTQSALAHYNAMVDEVLNFDIEKIGGAYYNDEVITEEVLNFDSVLIHHGELIEEDKMMERILNVEVLTQSPKPIEKQYDIDIVLDNTVEINSIGKLKGENPFQDIVVSHILDESEKVTDKLVIKEDDYVKTYSHDVYMCDHLVQNVLDIGVNSVHYDVSSHQPLVDGILKKD